MTVLDRRLNAFREDLADKRLEGRVEAPSFVAGSPAHVRVPVLDMRRTPSLEAGIDTQLLSGQDVLVFDENEGFAWIQSVSDGYVGYVGSNGLAEGASKATHLVSAARTFVYPAPDLKSAPTSALSMGSLVQVVGFEERRGTNYAVLPSGEAVIAGHLRDVAQRDPDYVAVAERLIHTPYLWGGASAFGIDCSGLVQLSMRMSGKTVLRDSDMQAATIGDPIGPDQLKRGDLAFWKGHVAIVTDPETIIHANGHTMTVALEPLANAVSRISYLYGQPTGYRRP
ncbi:MAG: NlpC/P60 family protein [Mesorhizobium sp.]|nr:NlpC/P60 family protein [Mesorhizobium sp.]MCO5160845.1 NlpC/P60 family protein [Mesorhizobium sp.]